MSGFIIFIIYIYYLSLLAFRF